MKKLLSIIAVIAVAVISMHALETSKTPVKKYSAIVRLHTLDGRFFCSGVVVSAGKILTAGHCVLAPNPFPGLIPDHISKKPIQIRTSDNIIVGVFAVPLNANSTTDIAVLVGDFTKFDIAEVEKDTLEIHNSFYKDKYIKACGFPYGGNFVCITAVDTAKYSIYYGSYDGGLWPGMSGGPVFNKHGKIIGLNQAVSKDMNIYSPLVALEELFKIKI
jgi:S1-C subfamily serine protease